MTSVTQNFATCNRKTSLISSLSLLSSFFSSLNHSNITGNSCKEFIFLKMSGEENKKVKAKTDSELFMNNANECDWKIFKSESCAGANAASRADMKLATTDPLSEIVWSPEKGLSLKCADKNSSLFRVVGPSCYMVLSPPQSVTYCNSITQEPIAVACVDRGNADTMSDSDVKPDSKVGEENNIGKGKKVVEIEDDLHTVVEPIFEYRGSGDPRTNLASSSRNPLGEFESSAENDIRNVDAEAACAATCGVIVKEIKNETQDNEMVLLSDKVLPVSHSPCNSGIRAAENKGKEKFLSDGDANVRLSMDSESNSSVESCNSARFFSTGKKRRNFQQQKLVIGSKRVKNNAEETSGSKSYVKQESSFNNWISSMVKGLSQTIQNDSNTLALRNANADHHNARFEEKLITCRTNQDPEPKNTGFRSIFQSMYGPTLKKVGTRRFHREGESNEDFEPSNMVHGINATPITCFPDNNSLAERHFQSNKFEASTDRYDAGPSQPNIEPLNYFNSKESRKNKQLGNENCSNMDLSKDKEEMASNSSSARQNTNDSDNIDSNAPSGRKETENIDHRRDNPGSLWLTRFAPKSTSPLFNDLSSSPGFANSEQIPEVKTLVHDRIDNEIDENISLKQKSNDFIAVKIECNASCKKNCGSTSSKENKFNDKAITTSPLRLAERKISHMPEEIFDAVKKLQLSRSDILKWITSHGSISELDGFFLRLRVGKLEEGLGGTGYHVAYIIDTGRHSLEQHTRKSLSVKVKGIECMVESHYISNQEFLEEEIMEWWSNTSEAGVEIPSEEELISKFKKKQLLGL
ncbi:uncharacterized protein LOC131652558 isoform X2 [Vicia villosa]|uniref:uncharacterized protein LOC131652558 isoform X2 n=1 Tax=Vicia villosa TaxID=3911 RepID=UPI00273AE0A4|nr:uncharacterized protein LOC131652558 isoform X2 [Vicia villosa]